MNPTVAAVTQRVRERSISRREAYLSRLDAQAQAGPSRGALSCGNLAHGMAACSAADKSRLTDERVTNIGVVSAYNDMLSAHQPYEGYPALIRAAAEECGAVAQVAGGVPAMCDGVTQGQDGMELSLFSRDVIALSTSIALSHNMFDSAMYLGVCDKIVPGLLIGALSFGHLPGIFVPAGPMPSGLPNKEKARVRELHAAGEVGRDELIAAESASYHSPGTCTFYGTANSNQMLLEMMGLQLPGSSFVNPTDPMRDLLTREAVRQVLSLTFNGPDYTPIGRIVDEKAVVNALVGLLATGGSTNHTIHLVAMAAAAGITIDWADIAELSRVVPLLARVYPNGHADVNQFDAAGGLAFVIAELLNGGLVHEDVQTVVGPGLERYTRRPFMTEAGLRWREEVPKTADRGVLRPVDEPFSTEGGIQLVDGNLGRAIVKVSAVAPEHLAISAPARVFDSQAAFVKAFEAGEMTEDVVVVITGQGPRANGMPELHRLSPSLGVMQNRGQRVALLTDGRMSGASGSVLSAIHVTPEAATGGAIGRLRDGDVVTLDAGAGVLRVDAPLEERVVCAPQDDAFGMGREMFSAFRDRVGPADTGGSIFSS